MTEIPLIISVDDHIVEPPDLWQRWLPEKYRDRGPRVVKSGWQVSYRDGRYAESMIDDGPQVDWWTFENIKKILPVSSHWAGRTRDENEYVPANFADMRPGFYDPKARLLDMDMNHTERSLCFPNIMARFCGQTFYESGDKDLGLACLRAYNDFMLDEWCGDSGGRLIPMCLIPLWDPELAAAEVRLNAGRGNKAISFPELPTNLGLPSIHDPGRYWYPLFDACNETSTAICIHIGSGSKMQSTSTDAPKGVGTALNNFNSMMSLTDWLLSGVLLRFPDLRVAFSESQIGWMPFIYERVDNVFMKARKYAQLDPIITDLPSSQVPGRVYGCFFEDDFGLKNRHEVGVRQITFEVDYPHQDTTWPNSLQYLTKVCEGLPAEEIYQITRGNAIELLGLPAELSVEAGV